MTEIRTITLDSNSCSVTKYGQIILKHVAYDLLSQKCNVILPNEIDGASVKFIGDGCFEKLHYIKSIKLPEDILCIGASAFKDCWNLKNINLPNILTRISESTFQNCKGLTNITIPNTVESIEDFAFWNCVNLKYLELPSSVKHIGEDVFSKCKGINVEYKGTQQQLDKLFKDSQFLKRNLADNNIVMFATKEIDDCIEKIKNNDTQNIELDICNTSQQSYFNKKIGELSDTTNDLNKKLEILTVRDSINKHAYYEKNTEIER